MKDVRDGIKPAIAQSGYKQAFVAEKIGMTEQQISDISNKRRKLDANEMIDFCLTIGITPNDLMELANRSA